MNALLSAFMFSPVYFAIGLLLAGVFAAGWLAYCWGEDAAFAAFPVAFITMLLWPAALLGIPAFVLTQAVLRRRDLRERADAAVDAIVAEVLK